MQMLGGVLQMQGLQGEEGAGVLLQMGEWCWQMAGEEGEWGKGFCKWRGLQSLGCTHLLLDCCCSQVFVH